MAFNLKAIYLRSKMINMWKLSLNVISRVLFASFVVVGCAAFSHTATAQSSSTWVKIVVPQHNSGVKHLIPLPNGNYLSINTVVLPTYVNLPYRYHILTPSLDIDTTRSLYFPASSSSIQYDRVHIKEGWNYILNGALIGSAMYVHRYSAIPSGHLVIFDTLGNVVKMFNNSEDMLGPLPINGQKFIAGVTYGYTSNISATTDLLITDTSGTCYKMWRINIPYILRLGLGLYPASNNKIAINIMSSQYSPFGSVFTFAFAFADTLNNSVVVHWYRPPSQQAWTHGALYLSNNFYLIYGYVVFDNKAVVVAIDSTGSQRWARRIANYCGSWAGSRLLNDGRIALVGLIKACGSSTYDILITVFDTLGNLLKAVRIGHPASREYASDIYQLPDGSFLVGGRYGSNIQPLYLKLDSNFNLSSCTRFRSINITDSLVIDTIPMAHTITSLPMSVVTCYNLNPVSINEFLSIDSPYYAWDSPQVVIDTVITPTCSYDSGVVVASATGGYSPYAFIWNNNSSSVDTAVTDTFINTSGTYPVYVIGSDGCQSQTVQATIPSGPPPITVNVDSLSDVLCYGDSTGYISVSVRGGLPPYLYQWNTGDSVSLLDSLPVGTYVLHVVDSSNCETFDTFVITQPQPLTVTIDTSNSPLLSSVANGGVQPYECLWNTGDRTCQITASSSGTYWVEVTDANGCTTSDTVVVSVVGIGSVSEMPCSMRIDDIGLFISCSMPAKVTIYDLNGKELVACQSTQCYLPLIPEVAIMKINNKWFKVLKMMQGQMLIK